MFYRYTESGARQPVDLDGLYHEETCFIAGGAPSLKQFEAMRAYLNVHPHIIAINNAATVVRPTIWIGCDKPVCYDKSILYDTTYPKFARICRRDEVIDGRFWHSFPNTLFFGDRTNFTTKNLLKPDRDLVWWKNTFFTALQFAYRLGFRKVYLVGCGFRISKESQYAWKTDLDEKAVNSNVRLYGNSVNILKELLPHFKDQGFSVISSTPDSLANAILDYESVSQVLEELKAALPLVDTVGLPHSQQENLGVTRSGE